MSKSSHFGLHRLAFFGAASSGGMLSTPRKQAAPSDASTALGSSGSGFDESHARYFVHRSVSDAVDFFMKAYILKAPLRSSGPVVFWELRCLVSKLGFGASFQLSEWVRDSFAAWRTQWIQLGLDSADFRFSIKSALSPQKMECDASSSSSASHAREYTLSSSLLIALLLYLATRASKPGRRASAITVLDIIVKKAVGERLTASFSEPPQLLQACGCQSSPAMQGKHVDFVSKSIAERFGDSPHLHVAGVMGVLAGASRCPRVAEWLHCCIVRLAEVLDKGAGGFSDKVERLLVLRGAVRARRLDAELVDHMAVQVVQDKRQKSATAYAREAQTFSEATARAQQRRVMANYLWNIAKVF